MDRIDTLICGNFSLRLTRFQGLLLVSGRVRLGSHVHRVLVSNPGSAQRDTNRSSVRKLLPNRTLSVAWNWKCMNTLNRYMISSVMLMNSLTTRRSELHILYLLSKLITNNANIYMKQGIEQ